MKKYFFSTIIVGLLLFCQRKAESIPAGQVEMAIKITATEQVAVTVYTPAKAVLGDILVLPGYGFRRNRWLDETRLKKLADKYGYRLVCPEMFKTVYASAYFPETTRRWTSVPGVKFIRQYLIVQLRKKGIFQEDGKNFILGLSTGGRGAALIALDNPNLFTAIAALSGDFDQTAMPNDRLMRNLYGDYPKFKDRWKNVDNAVTAAPKMKAAVYIGHGAADRIVPVSQSRLFYDALKKVLSPDKLVYNEPKSAGHDFKYWDSELDAVFKFFNRSIK